MKQYKGYLIDLDGTMYKGSERIEAASDFVNRLKSKGIPYLFVTNNSTRRPEQVAEKLRSFDISADSSQVFTTSQATASYIAEQKAGAKVYMIGEEGLAHALKEQRLVPAGKDADYVVVGLDRDVTYEKLAVACLAVRNGAIFLSTNGDIAIPTERGLMPGNGSITSVIAVSTQVNPMFIGKPEAIIMEQALEVLGTAKEETLMVGDYYDTDILAGMNAGLDTLLVHTGVTTHAMMDAYEKKPTYAIDSLDEWEV
ncbi:TIGR01457 family HAD-type hydrolase [Neobacillus notoginsengisoli]|uniref:TIGR01457 family HAD-type hydrolase n=1 Tax=Neobacillus notoginsengisoli TaxID=1578198 RepID=A0A417YYT8_9BACI|nr:TIGR01457 family HAD-type hydrolase [Neobacillus notoginsengisoli]RHW42874.1 TIGR01457 family HAD-type hydrolase [Neobacillus notoginsengisoli]